jgi:hypothetical protein
MPVFEDEKRRPDSAIVEHLVELTRRVASRTKDRAAPMRFQHSRRVCLAVGGRKPHQLRLESSGAEAHKGD